MIILMQTGGRDAARMGGHGGYKPLWKGGVHSSQIKAGKVKM